jgi:hypothetical protein
VVSYLGWRAEAQRQANARADKARRLSVWISVPLQVAIMKAPKIGTTTLGAALKYHPQWQSADKQQLVEMGLPRIIRFLRNDHDRLVSAWLMLNNQRRDQSFPEFLDWVAEDPLRDEHVMPQQLIFSYEGRYLPTEEYPLSEMTPVLESFGCAPPLRIQHLRKADSHKPYAEYYTPEMWEQVSRIYAEYD